MSRGHDQPHALVSCGYCMVGGCKGLLAAGRIQGQDMKTLLPKENTDVRL